MDDPADATIDLDAVQESLGYRFKDSAILERALTHRSHAYEQGAGAGASYERLEFLGDALLGLFVSDWLFRDDLEATEGLLSRRRQSVVKMSTLAGAADQLGLGRGILLGRGEEQTGGRTKRSLLADAFEAVVAAIYIDGGIRPAKSFVRRELASSLRETRGATRTADDFKTRFQEVVQGKLRLTPCYRIVARTGPDHALEFTVEVRVGERVVASGSGRTRKLAEQAAAAEALKGWVDEGDS